MIAVTLLQRHPWIAARNSLGLSRREGEEAAGQIAEIALTEAGLDVCAAAHDGFLLLAREEDMDAVERISIMLMKATGEALLGIAPEVTCEQKVLWSDSSNRFDPGKDPREMWEFLQHELEQLKLNQQEVRHAIA